VEMNCMLDRYMTARSPYTQLKHNTDDRDALFCHTAC